MNWLKDNQKMNQILKDKDVLLTGDSRGIGAGRAVELGKQGDRL